jgi:hypothetical protein
MIDKTFNKKDNWFLFCDFLGTTPVLGKNVCLLEFVCKLVPAMD